MKHVVLGAVFLSLAAVAAQAEPVEFTLTNVSDLTIAEVYAAPSNTTTWGEDMLGGSTVAPGGDGVATIDDGSDQCSYDLLVVDEAGTEYTLMGLDLCASPAVEFSN